MQGFNMGRYVPPDVEGTKVSGNALHGRRPPGHSSTPGHQTVRFEMPFAVWCDNCPRPTIIGQGVRFNADKSRDGNYYSTPIWKFRIRHADCGGEIVLRTDPQNTAYQVISGGRKRDYGDAAESSDGQILTDAEREELRRNAFSKLERTIDDRERLIASGQRIDSLLEISSRHWDDPYTQNQRLRKSFRKGRHERERDSEYTENLRDRAGLGIEILPASDDDARRAAVVDFAPEEEDAALTKPLFKKKTAQIDKKPTADNKTRLLSKAERQADARKKGFMSKVMDNTRITKDPFLGGKSAMTTTRLSGVKRKRGDSTPEDEATSSKTPGGLVDYDSD